MIGKTVFHFKILEKIGEGGMGIVYKAEDTKLKRTVALKFLPAELTKDPQAKARFIQEARAAAVLDHPSICAVFEIGEVEGATYIAMPYIKGQSLKEKIISGPLSIAEALDIAGQVAEGLKEAHERGIIHRDIKPANIMLTEKGQAKIMDFGLAKLTSGADVTKTLAVVGTIAYMSPEQAKGEPVDQRTDVWAFGATLYEMLTGQMPFGRKHDQALIYSILNDTPESPSRFRPEIPNYLERVIHKALEKDKLRRYQNMADLLEDLKSTQIVGFGPQKVEKSIIVLPFENISPDPDQEYFCDGMTEEIITDLSHVHDLLVISRSSAMTFKGTKKKIKEIAQEVNVRYVLEGSVRKAGNNLRIAAQLIDSSTDAHLWAEKFSGTLDDVFDIQEKVSRSIVDALKLKLSPEEKRKIAEPPIDNITAYECYIRATGVLFISTEEACHEALRYFEYALSTIGENALIYSGMAYAHFLLVNIGVQMELNRKKAEKFVHKALALDPGMPKASALLGYLNIWYRGKEANLKEAARQFRMTLEADPKEPTALLGQCFLCLWAGKRSAAIPLMERYRQVEPVGWYSYLPGAFHFYEGHYDLAVQEWGRWYKITPYPGSRLSYVWALAYNRQIKEALAIIEEGAAESPPNHVHTKQALMVKHALQGDKQGALQVLTPDFYDWCRREGLWSYHIASDFALLNAKEEALEWLENSVDCGHINYPLFAEKDPWLANIRAEPRFQKLMERVKYEWEHFEI